MTLRKLIEDAQHQLDTYKHPNVDKVQDRLDAILKAGNAGGLKYDKITSLSFYSGFLEIATEYEVRCCRQTGEYKIPESVIDADDPIREMKLWAAKVAVKKAQDAYYRACYDVSQTQVALMKAKDKLAAQEKEI